MWLAGLRDNARTGTPIKRMLLGAALVVVALMSVFVPAGAQEGGESVTSTLTSRDDTNERVPAAGVTVVILDATGAEVTTTTTDDEGTFLVPLPGPGDYTVEIDPATLPDGISLRDPTKTSVTVTIGPGQAGRVIFSLQVGDAAIASGGVSLRQVLQLTVEGIKLGLFLGMASIGLSLIFGTTGLTNFAHSEMITGGMLVAYFFNFYGLAGVFGFMAGWPAPFGGGVNLIFAALIAVVLGGAWGWALDAWVFAPLRRRGTSLIAQLLVTIGLAMAFRFFFLFIFDGRQRFFADFTAQTAIKIGVVDITPKDLVSGGISIFVLVMVGILISRTRTGKAMRAVADNRDLAESSGIDVQRIIRTVWVVGSALASLGGVFIGLSEQVSYLTGFRILLLIFAAVVLGGLGTAYGAFVGALMVGIGVQVSTIFIPIELKNVGALARLIIVLVIRPQGILGRAERVG